MNSALQIFVRAALIAVALFAAVRSFHWAQAETLFLQKTQGSLLQAAALEPRHPQYAQVLAESSQDDAQKVVLLKKALALNPFDSRLWIDLGFEAELRQNDVHSAEHDYLKAAQVDHMFTPRWTLANFYFRQANAASYFDWAHRAIAITPYDPTPIFDQLWSISQDPNRIAAAIPGQYRPLYLYLAFLLSTNRLDFIGPAAERALAAPITQPELPPLRSDRANLLGLTVDQLCLRGDHTSALALWRNMHHASITNLPDPNPALPLSNGDFDQPFLNHGFDWKIIPVQGIAIDRMFGANEVRFLFTGSEPESSGLLQQFLPVTPGARYVISYQTSTVEGDSAPGVEWHLYPVAPGEPPSDKTAIALSANPPGPAGTTEQAFTVPATSPIVILSLEYRRPLGKTRWEGTLLLRRVVVKRI